VLICWWLCWCVDVLMCWLCRCVGVLMHPCVVASMYCTCCGGKEVMLMCRSVDLLMCWSLLLNVLMRYVLNWCVDDCVDVFIGWRSADALMR
jgi:hypothetical protein